MNLDGLAAYGLLGQALVFGALAALLPFGEFRPRVGLAATTLALLIGIAPALHGAFGPPSPTLLALALLQLAGRSPSPLGLPAALLVLLVGVPLQLAGGEPLRALGLQPAPLFAVLLPLAAALFWRRRVDWLLILAVDLAAYAGGVFANLWDALLDPLLLLLAGAVLGRRLLQSGLSGSVRR